MMGSLNLRDQFLMCLVKWKDDKFQRICNNSITKSGYSD